MKNSPKTLKKRNELKRKWKKEIDPNSFAHKIKKVCKDCKQLKLCEWQSSFTQTGKPEYRARCDKCQKIYLHKIRTSDNYKKLRNIRRKKELLRRKQWAVNYLGGKCKKCNYDKCLSALTFHHKNPDEKEYEIGQMMDWQIDRIIKELKKCDLLCFNCHMELHEELNK
jgi:hypothetical protein